MSLIPISELDEEEEEKSVGGTRRSEQRGGGFALAAGGAKLSHAPLPLSGRTDRQREKESTRSREGAHIDRRIMGQVSKPYSHPLGSIQLT